MSLLQDLYSQNYGFSFPVVICGCESWATKKAECPKIDAFELWCWRRGRDGWMAASTQCTWVWANWELVKDREARCAAVHRFMKSWTQFSDWTTAATKADNDFTCNMDFIHRLYFPLPSLLHTHAHTHSLGNHSLDSSFPLCNSNLFLSSGFLRKYLSILKSLSL